MCFIDHVRGYISIKNQVAINSTETIKEKIISERDDQSQVVVIKGCQTDNGIFNVSYSMEGLLKNQKNIMFSWAGASH